MATVLLLPAALTLSLTAGAVSAQDFVRGDANVDGAVNIADTIMLLSYLIGQQAGLPCLDAADFNDDGVLNIVDPVYQFRYFFTAGTAPPPPPLTACGVDPTPDALDCLSFPGCP